MWCSVVLLALPLLTAQESPSKDEIPGLIKMLGSNSPGERDEAELRLKRIGDRAIPHLNAAVNDANSEVAERAKRALQAIVSPDFSSRILAKVARVEWGTFGLAFSPDGRTLAGSTGDATTLIWDAVTGRTLATLGGSLPDVAAHCVAFSPDGKTLAGRGSPGRRMSVWDVATRTELVELKVEAETRAVAFSPDGSRVATGEGGRVRLWEAATGKEQTALERIEGGQVLSLAFTSDGRHLVAASNAFEANVGVWDVGTRKVVRVLRHSEGVYAVAISPSSPVIATGSVGGTVRLWDLETGGEIGRIDRDADAAKPYVLASLAYSPRGNLLASGGSDGHIRLWSAASRKSIARFASGTGAGWVRSIAFSPDGKTFASTGGVLWNVADIAGK